MRFICLDDDAMSDLIQDRKLQSVDFEEGDELAKQLGGPNSPSALIRRVGGTIMTLQPDGVFFSTPGPFKEKRYLVIDTEQSRIFENQEASDHLATLQKLMRFSVKYWKKLPLQPTEMLIAHSTKAIIFPLPYSERSGFRVAIERAPLEERLAKRDMGGRFLLVYKSGWDKADSQTEVADLTNFRRAFEALPGIYAGLDAKAKSLDSYAHQRQSKILGETCLTKVHGEHGRSPFRPFGEWLSLLSRKQLAFVTARPRMPQRINGPAGTGKTVCLILRTAFLLRAAIAEKVECKALFVTHSEATKETVENLFDAIEPGWRDRYGKAGEPRTLKIQTLAGLCAEVLAQVIESDEFVDRDAQDSKIVQELYVEESLKEAKTTELKSFAPFFSEDFRKFIDETDDASLAALFRHEISVLIKGRVGGAYDAYKSCPPLKYGIPTRNEADKGFAFKVYELYQSRLEKANQFDTDDVVLSAVGQLDTPIWRRRRAREGYDLIVIDETHLFNINELHAFHYFTKSTDTHPISFSFDPAQAVGDWGWDELRTFSEIFGVQGVVEDETTISSVFRSCPDIVALCGTILASGATLFTGFGLRGQLTGAFDATTEKLCVRPAYVEYPDDEAMLEAAFRRVDELAAATNSRKWEVLITSLSFDLMQRAWALAKARNKPVTFLDRRGDYNKVDTARASGHFVVGHADYVGGLEFNAVIVLGVDKGRVPEDVVGDGMVSKNFARYAAHNRLYVACSRAKYALELLGVRARGASELLTTAIHKKVVTVSPGTK